MTDPQRLLTSGATEFERAVLRAAKFERPTAKQSRRMRQALFFAEFGFLAASVKALASMASPMVLSALVAGAVAHTDTAQLRSSQTRRPSVASLSPRQLIQTTSSVAPQANGTEKTPELPTGTNAAAKAERRSRQSDHPLAAPHRDNHLAEELRSLDQVRTLLRENRPEQALVLVRRYFGQFPRGSFHQEAQVLRVEALSRSGKKAAAADAARTFRAKHPDSPHIEKLDQLAD